MTTLRWPTISRTPDPRSFRETPEDTAIVAQTEGGYQFSRPRHTRRPRLTFAFRLVDLVDEDKLALESFWNQVRGRSLAFLWTHPTKGVDVLVRFDGPIEFQHTVWFVKPDGSISYRWNVPNLLLKEV